jgi:hypothetical protein
MGAANRHQATWEEGGTQEVTVRANDIVNKSLIEVKLATSLTRLMIWGVQNLQYTWKGHFMVLSTPAS